MTVAKEGIPFILLFGAVAAAGSWWELAAGIPLWVVAGWCVWFFRDPDREVPTGNGLVVAPADGRVIVIEEVAAAPLTGQPARKVSIFMNVFNVHVNRAPERATVAELAYHPGKFLNAAVDKASELNERQEILLRLGNGRELVMVQVAGLIARRIVCRLNQGDAVERGERFGLIRFGSRVDLYLPLGARVECGLGEHTVAGSTVIARLE